MTLPLYWKDFHEVAVKRPIQIVIPFKLDNAKSRLAPVLSPEERRLLALAMLRDVLQTVSGTGPVMVLSRPGFHRLEVGLDVDLVESGLELSDALNAFIEDWQKNGWAADLLIVMADLALLSKDDVRHIIEAPGDVVLSPGRGGGTNMILIRSPAFRICYRGISFPRHLDLAQRLGLSVGMCASYTAGCDIDEPEDLPEVLIHNRGGAQELLRSLGFVLSENGRADCVRYQAQESLI